MILVQARFLNVVVQIDPISAGAYSRRFYTSMHLRKHLKPSVLETSDIL